MSALEHMPSTLLAGKKILLIISGGIAAYKSLELIRLLRKKEASVTAVLTDGGARFVTPLSVSALCGKEVYTDLWSVREEMQSGGGMDHIGLVREADAVVMAPASANRLARLAGGIADDLASTMLLASTRPLLLAPAMNAAMWAHPATCDNIAIVQKRGAKIIAPGIGDSACGEYGQGRMAEPAEILAALQNLFSPGLLKGKNVLVTSGPTYEPLDPVRFFGNRSSGRQGHAIATAMREAGANVTLVTGPVSLEDPAGVRCLHVETALEMRDACRRVLPLDIAVCAAAVADWRPRNQSAEKLKKGAGRVTKKPVAPPVIEMIENPDILAELSAPGPERPELVVGFAAETCDHERHAMEKLDKKGCDILILNDVGRGKVFGSDDNRWIVLRRVGPSRVGAKTGPDTTVRGGEGERAVKGVNGEQSVGIAEGKHIGADIEKTVWDVDSKAALAQRLVTRIVAWMQDR